MRGDMNKNKNSILHEIYLSFTYTLNIYMVESKFEPDCDLFENKSSICNRIDEFDFFTNCNICLSETQQPLVGGWFNSNIDHP